ncbi:MAG: hypothetical protein Fur003_0280 [Candidatus Dojkabacteria bacterium]
MTKTAKTLLAFLFVLIALGVLGLATMRYLRNNTPEDSDTDNTTSQEQDKGSEDVIGDTNSEIDDALDEVDQSLQEIDDSTNESDAAPVL